MKHLKIFDTSADLQTYMDGPDYLEPFVGTDTQKSVVKYNRVAQNVIRIFTQRGGVTLAKYLDDQMSNMEEFELKEGWNNLDMTNDFKYGFGNVNGEELNELTKVEFSRYQGTNLIQYMFYNTGIKAIVLPDTIEEIGYNCFNQNYMLKKVILSKNLKRISAQEFFECRNLSDINLYEGIVEIGQSAFRNTHIEKIIIPSTVKIIENYFYSFYSEEEDKNGSVRFQSLTPPEFSIHIFDNIDRIEVPNEAVETYKNINIPGWKEKFGDKIVGY